MPRDVLETAVQAVAGGSRVQKIASGLAEESIGPVRRLFVSVGVGVAAMSGMEFKTAVSTTTYGLLALCGCDKSASLSKATVPLVEVGAN